MKDIKSFIFENTDDKYFNKGKLKLGQICIDREGKYYIWIPKANGDILDDFDCKPNPMKGGCFLTRQSYNKGAFAIARGWSQGKGFASYDKNLYWKGMKNAADTIVKVYKTPLPKDILNSRTFQYDFEDTIKKHIEQDNYIER